jgi:hypothetical protein
MAPSSKDLSAFAQAALTLDAEFAQFERLSGELERLEIDSDSGLERGRLLLTRVSECGQRVGVDIQALASALTEAQARAQAAAQAVSVRADLVQARQQQVNVLADRFKALGEMVRAVTEAVGQLKLSGKSELSPEAKGLLAQHLPELESRLGGLIDEALNIKLEARSAQMKGLERDADSMAQSIQAVQKKISLLSEQFIAARA